MGKIKISYNNTFATKHSRDYYRGASFHYSGKGLIGAHYVSDDYNVDFVVHDQVLLACARSHLATLENEPNQYIKDENGLVTGIVSEYGDFVLAGICGRSPGIKIVDNYGYTCEDTNLPVEKQVGVNTGIKVTFEYEDLTPEQIAELQQPGIDAATNVINERTVQTTGQSTLNIMSQKATTDAINDRVLSGTTEYGNSRGSYIPNEGVIIVYTDYQTVTEGGTTKYYPEIKIGTGNGYLSDLAFIGEYERDILLSHVLNTDIHITPDERARWNNKINVNDLQETLDETLIINRN